MLLEPIFTVSIFVLPVLFVKQQKRLDIAILVVLYFVLLLRGSSIGFLLPQIGATALSVRSIAAVGVSTVLFFVPWIYVWIHRTEKSMLLVGYYDLCLMLTMHDVCNLVGTVP